MVPTQTTFSANPSTSYELHGPRTSRSRVGTLWVLQGDPLNTIYFGRHCESYLILSETHICINPDLIYDLIFPKNNTNRAHNPGLQKNILPVHKSTNQGTVFSLSFCTFVQSEQILKHPNMEPKKMMCFYQVRNLRDPLLGTPFSGEPCSLPWGFR